MIEQITLKEMQFSDLMLFGSGKAYLRHVKGYIGPVIPAPESLTEDLAKLRVGLEARAAEREFLFHHDDVPYRVAKIDTLNGSGYFLRRPRYPVPQLHSLGFKKPIVETLLNLGKTSGMLLFAGATGSGKSTSIYSLIQEYVTNNGDIVIAVEDPPEIPMQGAYGENEKGLWYQVDAKAAGGYEVAMISAMRYNPRYIFIGEIRSPTVANEAIRAAVNGHLVLATIHGNSIPGAILAIQQIAAAATGSIELARSILADGLQAVVHQQLVCLPDSPGERFLESQVLCFGNEVGLRAKIRSGKLEHLSSDIESQRIKVDRGFPLI